MNNVSLKPKYGSHPYLNFLTFTCAFFIALLLTSLFWLEWQTIYSLFDGVITFIYLFCMFYVFFFLINLAVGFLLFYLGGRLFRHMPFVSSNLPVWGFFFVIFSYLLILPYLYKGLNYQVKTELFANLGILIGTFLASCAGLGLLSKVFNRSRLRRLFSFRAAFSGGIMFLLIVLIINLLFPNTYLFQSHFRSNEEINIPDETSFADEQDHFEKRNIFLITYDALRSDHISAFGYERETSPFLDTLVEQSAAFTNVTAAYPQTSQSFASPLSGLYPWSHGVWQPRSSLPNELMTLAEELALAGYSTYGVVANVNLFQDFGYNQGFNIYVSMKNDDPKSITDRLIELADKGLKEPFFVWVYYLDPHGPYKPPDVYRSLFEGDDLYKRDLNSSLYQKNLVGPNFSPLEVADALCRYDGEIRAQDEELERLYHHFAEGGYLENTILIFSSDHGEYFGHHGYYFNHGLSPYKDMQVPLVFHAPGLILPNKYRYPVELIDLAPTILHFTGIRPQVMSPQGLNLAPFLLQEKNMSMFPRNHAFGTAYVVSKNGDPQYFILRTDEYELIVNKLDHLKRIKSIGQFLKMSNVLISKFRGTGTELYQISTDPAERRNIAGEKRDVVLNLKNRMGDILSRYETDRMKKSTLSSVKQLDIDVVERLKSLGYIK